MAFVPFNFDPSIGAAITSGSKTVPSGKYAFIHPISSDLQIDGVLAYIFETDAGASASGASFAATNVKVATQGDYVRFSLDGSGATYTIKNTGDLTNTIGTFSGTFPGVFTAHVTGSGLTIEMSGNTGGYSWSATIFRLNHEPFVAEAGQVINGTRYLYTEYTSIT